jgi:pimeloyl-ACP methyl ester carboxylesterase
MSQLARRNMCASTWAPQAALLAAHGFHVLAFDFRGYGESLAPSSPEHAEENARLDVLAAVRYLHVHGAQTLSVVGASFGGSAAADASADSAPGEIDRVVLLAHGSSNHPELIKGRKLFIVSRHDTDGSGTVRLTEMREDYERVPPPKRHGAAPAWGLQVSAERPAKPLNTQDSRDPANQPTPRVSRRNTGSVATAPLRRPHAT